MSTTSNHTCSEYPCKIFDGLADASWGKSFSAPKIARIFADGGMGAALAMRDPALGWVVFTSPIST